MSKLPYILFWYLKAVLNWRNIRASYVVLVSLKAVACFLSFDLIIALTKAVTRVAILLKNKVFILYQLR
jgi:hypothetical protein